MTAAPNLYSFATKELAQDATLAYILAWAKPEYRTTHPRLHELGTAMLRALVGTWKETVLPAVTSLEVETQVERIDVLARIDDENGNRWLLLVEDKVETDEHSNQIERYICTAKKIYPGRKIVPVYMKTGNASQRSLPCEGKFGRFLRHDLLAVLNGFLDTGDTIVDNFRTHLGNWERETNGYRDLDVSRWTYRACEGFYVELENRLLEAGVDVLGWGYAANQKGGVRYFAFLNKEIAWAPDETWVYLQIEDATRLVVRLRGKDWSEKIRAPIMRVVLERLKDEAGRSGDIKIEKAGRFRGGKTAAVAEITDYPILTSANVVDIDETVARLINAQEFVAKVAETPVG